MKLPGIFELTKREQRVVILTMIVLLAGAVAKRYHDAREAVIPAKSAPADSTARPPENSPDDENNDPDSREPEEPTRR